MKKIFSLSLVSVIVISIIFCACSKSSTPAMNTTNFNTVSIKNMAFSPSTLSVTVATTITWVNNDGITHTVTADNGSFNSGNITPGNSFTHTFSAIGTVSYHCSIHPMMIGSVTVK